MFIVCTIFKKEGYQYYKTGVFFESCTSYVIFANRQAILVIVPCYYFFYANEFYVSNLIYKKIDRPLESGTKTTGAHKEKH